MKKIFKNHLVCITLAILSFLSALLFAPIWGWWEKCPWGNWGNQIVNLLIAAVIICYLVFYLFKKFKMAKKRVILVLTIVEFSLLSLIALGCLFSQFKIINVSEAGQIFSLAIWIRGAVELFRAYYYKSDSNEVYPVWYLALSIGMVTFGAYCFARPIITNAVILWLFVSVLITAGIILSIMTYQNIHKIPFKTNKEEATEETI